MRLAHAAWAGILAGCAAAATAATLVGTPEDANAQLQKLRAGDTLLLKPGVYRQTLDLRNRDGEPGAPITIRGDTAQGRVVLRGSDVLSKWKALDNGLFSHALAKEPSQIFVDGQVYTQVGGTVFDGYPVNPRSEYKQLHPHDGGIWPGRIAPVVPALLPVGSFWYDKENKRVLVRASRDLTAPGVTVEASQRERVVFVENVRHMVIQDLEIQHANTSVTNRGGALVVWRSEHVRLKGIVATWNDLTGIQFAGDSITLEDSQAHHNGQTGVSGFGKDITVSRVKANHNNRRGFNKWWEAGGFKFIGFDEGALRGAKIQDCQALHNQGDGIWFDWKNQDVEISRNVSAYNTGFGIHYEASSRGLLQDNLVFGNGQRGIYLSSSRFSTVRNNLVMGNGGEGIVAIAEAGRTDNSGNKFKAEGNRFEGNVVAWNSEGSVIVSSDEGSVSDGNVFMSEGAPTRFSVDFPSPLNPPVYGLEAWSRRSGQDRRSWWIHRPMPPQWQNYLAQKSTAMAPLQALLQQSRSTASDDKSVLGGAVPEGRLRSPTPEAGPRFVGK